MKYVIIWAILFLRLTVLGQITLEDTDFKNLLTLGELYSKGSNVETRDQFLKSVDSLRTPRLEKMVEIMKISAREDTAIFNKKYQSRPTKEEMILWYVIRELHYNKSNESNKPKPPAEVAKKVLSEEIDERWLLDNYYYRINRSVGDIFNDADLSSLNFDIENLGLKNETEKAIYYLNLMNSLVGGRFRVLQYMKDYQKVLSFADKLPLFNGKKYFYYINFNYKDFEWIGYEKKEKYNVRNIGNLFEIETIHFVATSNLRSKKEAQEIYFNSILYQPKYFDYSVDKKDLEYLYKNSSKK